jgi:uncharacterized protein (TIGR03067 family)
MRTLFGVGMAAALAVAAGGQEKKPDAKAEKLDGTYLIVGFEQGGVELPEEVLKASPEASRTVKIAVDKMTFMTKDGKEKTITVKFDPTKSPKQLTSTETKDGKLETGVGIYKLEGDTLTVCVAESDKEADRPKGFKSDKGSKTMVLMLRRQKDK